MITVMMVMMTCGGDDGIYDGDGGGCDDGGDAYLRRHLLKHFIYAFIYLMYPFI
jgi:hypothetical protein